MRTLVTGGAGFIGSHIVDALVEAGHTVSVVDDLSTGTKANVNTRARLYVADIRTSALADVFTLERPEVIFHEAARANVRESLERPVLYADVNVLGSLNILEQCRRFGVAKVVYASTGGAVYGEPRFLPVSEDHPVEPLDPYGASKHHVEHYLELYRKNFGLDFTILRYPNVYGPRQDPLGEAGVVAIFIGLMLDGRQAIINGTGDQERDFTYVSDIAQANLLALDKGSGRIYNVGTGVGTSVNEIFRLLRNLTDYDIRPIHGTSKAGEVYKTFLDARRAHAELGWKPLVSTIDGLTRTVAHFKDARVAEG